MTAYEARIEVGHRPGILDPQGGVIERALPALGYANVSHVRVGKSIRLAVEAPDEDSARVQVATSATVTGTPSTAAPFWEGSGLASTHRLADVATQDLTPAHAATSSAR